MPSPSFGCFVSHRSWRATCILSGFFDETLARLVFTFILSRIIRAFKLLLLEVKEQFSNWNHCLVVSSFRDFVAEHLENATKLPL